MSAESAIELQSLPDDLQSRLADIIRQVSRFWEQKSFNHFTNHGSAHSERVHRYLAQLAQEMPEGRRLKSDEMFIASAAARLYDVGMQSPGLKPVMDVDYRPGDLLSFAQLEQIRERKHLLTERLIVRQPARGYPRPGGAAGPRAKLGRLHDLHHRGVPLLLR